MISKTPSYLSRLSPLAAAIAFALTAPSLAYSKNFVIDTDKDNAEDEKTSLREAIAKINELGSEGDHKITFDSSLSGKTIEMTSVYLNNSKLTVDGSGAEDLTLSFSRYNYVSVPGRGSELARRSNYAAFLAYDSELTLENIDLLVVGERPEIRRPEARMPSVSGLMAVYASGSEVNLNNVSMSSTEESYGETSALQLLDSNVTISNSSFTKFNAPKYGGSLAFMAYGNNGQTEFSLNVVNSTFEDNESKYGGSAGMMVSVYSDRVYSFEDAMFIPVSISANVVIKDSTFNNNYAFMSLGNALFVSSDTSEYGEAAGQISSLSLALEGVTISNNKSHLAFGAVAVMSKYSHAEFAVVNSTIADNESKYGSALTGIFNTTSAKVDVAIAHTTITNNKSPIDYPSGSDKYESSPAVTFSIFGEDVVNHLEIANSIIANNERTTHENGDFMYGDKITIDSDIQLLTNKNKNKMNVRNSLIGVEEFFKSDDSPYTVTGSRIIGSDNLMGVDPMLGELMDNGGLTLTIAPLEGSPVINAGNTALVEEYELETDQRGRERILAGAPDMGAVEFCESDGDCNYEKKSGGLFGSFGFQYLMTAFGLAWLRRRKQA